MGLEFFCKKAVCSELTYPFLNELEGAFVFGHLQQLHRTTLVGGEATHLADHIPHKLAVLGQTLWTEITIKRCNVAMSGFFTLKL